MNEEEIRKCEIQIDNEIIPFNYFFEFNQKGKHIIKYSFKNEITKMNYMFFDCDYLISIIFSNFSMQNITNMSHLFTWCKRLTTVDLSVLTSLYVVVEVSAGTLVPEAIPA